MSNVRFLEYHYVTGHLRLTFSYVLQGFHSEEKKIMDGWSKRQCHRKSLRVLEIAKAWEKVNLKCPIQPGNIVQIIIK